MATLNEYQHVFDSAIKSYEAILYNLYDKLKKEGSEDEDLTDINYNQYINYVETVLQYLERNRVKYKYNKLSKDEYDLILQNISDNNENTYFTISTDYRIKSIDTLHSICTANDITETNLLSYNNIDSLTFDKLKEVNGTIKIPRKLNIDSINNISDLLVFGSINGMKIWGKDLPNNIIAENNDLKVLDNEYTLVQGIENKFGEYGTIPGYEDSTIDLSWGTNYDGDMVDAVNLIKIQNALLQDPRIKEITNIQINDIKNGIEIQIDLKPINTSVPVQIVKEFFNAG